MAVVRAGAQDITDHYPNPQGAQRSATKRRLGAATGRFWVMRGYVKARRAAANLPRPGGVTFAQRARKAVPDVAVEAVGAADGAGGGQHAMTPAESKKSALAGRQ